jgi:uncharacterized membrane protein YbhN (UPF0104 family)
MMPEMRNRATLLGALVSVLCLAGLIWWASRQEAPDLPDSGAELLAMVAAVALYALNTAVRGERWHRLLQEEGGTPRRADTHALNVVGYAANNVLPARAGDALRVVLMAPRAALTKRSIVGTLVAERLLDVVVLLVIFVIVGYGVLGEAGAGDLKTLAIVTVAGAVALAAVVLLVRRNERLRTLIEPMLASTLALRGRHGGRLLAITVAIWAIETGVWMCAAAAVGFDMNPMEGLYLVALASVFALIPSGPGYAGTQDAAVIIGSRAVGASESLALSFLITLRLVLVVPITLTGLALLATRYGGLRRTLSAREAPPG